MLVTLAVFVLLMVLNAELVQNTTAAAGLSRKRLDIDEQARFIMDCLGQDLARMVSRSDVDSYFPTQTGNAQMLFYSEVPGYADASAGASCGVSLVGYRVNTSSASANYNSLERCGSAVGWSASGSGGSGMVFLTPKGSTSGGVFNFEPLPNSTLSPSTNPDLAAWKGASSTLYQQIGAGVFRFSVCYLLRDGTYSTIPVLQKTPSGWGSSPFYASQKGAPTSSSDSGSGYAGGSRWYDSTGYRGYICTDATSGSAVWTPLGWGDVSAVVVTVAGLDNASLGIIHSMKLDLLAAAKALPDIGTSDLGQSSPLLPAQKWTDVIQSGSFATSSGLPVRIAGAIRVYERHFYLHTRTPTP
ncbi:hypothetical protein SAMN05444156_3007 [Verrucomicrobium sp. GAS474]|nr:hypothetical protein SAMN05444156_3007 [Verrucomicrobium sp. GAS474]